MKCNHGTTGSNSTQTNSSSINPITINIEFEGDIPADHKIPMMLYETKGKQTINLEGSLERRGGYSISFPKHSYEIDLKVDYPLANLEDDDDWILNANFIDKTFLRHVFSYELFREMHSDNRASNSKFIELELNGVYEGLYVLMEKLDKSSLQIDGKDKEAVIFKESPVFRPTYENFTPQKPANFHQQTYPKIGVEDRTNFIDDVRIFLVDSKQSEFSSGVGKIFDIRNIIDWHLLLLISNNSDGILKNYYLYKVDTATPLRIAPWDYDHSFGRDGDNELNLDTRPMVIEKSVLFSRLLQLSWYKTRLKARWSELNQINLLSVNGLKSRLIDNKNKLEKCVERNFERWDLSHKRYYDSNNFEEEIEIMLNFIELRHERLTQYFEKL